MKYAVAKRTQHFTLPKQWASMRAAQGMEAATGRKVIHLEKGDYQEEEFRLPPHVAAAAYDGLRDGDVRYDPGPGLPELREAIAAEVSARGRPTLPEEVVVTAGAKHSLQIALLTLLDGRQVRMPVAVNVATDDITKEFAVNLNGAGFSDGDVKELAIAVSNIGEVFLTTEFGGENTSVDFVEGDAPSRGGRRALGWLLIAILTTASLFAAAHVLTGVWVRYFVFTTPALAIGAALVVAWLTLRGRWGKALGYAALAYCTAATFLFWLSVTVGSARSPYP